MTKKATSILPFPVHFLLSSFALSLQPRLVTSKIRAKHDPTLKYMTNVVDFGQYSNNKIQRAVLPRTESGYSDTLRIFDNFVTLHP
ncbi:Zinc finger, C2H2 [Penicillium digitatum]|uniref:Zinc finger, C2H2 n=1 Tax=Penicillium digitatum TaxID=36651 RepID=A0A7T6XQM1_PENDI|nr:Zinc finger, C2H2 [Penicillium digitatum]